MKKPFDLAVASRLTLPGMLMLIHFTASFSIHALGRSSSLGEPARHFLIVSAFILPPLAVSFGTWAGVYALLHSGPSASRYAFALFNVLPVGIGLWYAYVLFRFIAGGPINPG